MKMSLNIMTNWLRAFFSASLFFVSIETSTYENKILEEEKLTHYIE